MGARRKARKRALDVLFESEQQGLPTGGTLAAHLDRASAGGAATALNPDVVELVRGVVEHQARIDEILTDASTGWPLDRMPAVDRTILRIGVFEVLWREDVPDAVAVSEAVQLASELSTDESPAFVNGVLGHVAATKQSLLPAVPDG